MASLPNASIMLSCLGSGAAIVAGNRGRGSLVAVPLAAGAVDGHTTGKAHPVLESGWLLPVLLLLLSHLQPEVAALIHTSFLYVTSLFSHFTSVCRAFCIAPHAAYLGIAFTVERMGRKPVVMAGALMSGAALVLIAFCRPGPLQVMMARAWGEHGESA